MKSLNPKLLAIGLMTGTAVAQDLTWTELAGRPELWPAQCTVKAAINFEGGVSIPVFTIQPAQDGSGDLLIQFALAASVTGQEVPVTVSLDGDLSMPSYLTVMAP